MGYTNKSFEIINKILSENEILSVIELGAQNNFNQPYLPAPYVSEWYIWSGIDYTAIDLNGENDSKKWDLSNPIKTNRKYDMVTDFGTSEHVSNYFQCLANMHKLCRVGGIIVHENPKTGNWPKHGYNYVDMQFYREFAAITGYDLLHIEEHPACMNTTDGWNIIAVMRKTKDAFIDEDQLPKFYNE